MPEKRYGGEHDFLIQAACSVACFVSSDVDGLGKSEPEVFGRP